MSLNEYLNKKTKRDKSINEGEKVEKDKEEKNQGKIEDIFIIGIIKVEENSLEQRIINFNFYDKIKRIVIELIGNNNKKRLIDCKIFKNDKRHYYYFPNKGYYKIKYEFKSLLDSTNYMFDNCDSLISLDLSNFNTQNVTDMSNMFSGCKSLISLDLSNFNTQNVTDMSNMFSGCNSLVYLDLSNFNTQNVTTMYYMFSGCKSLISLDLTHFNTQKVNNMAFMFINCDSLVSLDLSSFNNQNVNKIYFMFYNCRSLISLDISNFNTQQIDNMSQIFSECNSLISLDLPIINHFNINSMLYNNYSLIYKFTKYDS